MPGIALFEESFSMIASPGATKEKLTNTINRWRIIKMRKFEFISMGQFLKDMAEIFNKNMNHVIDESSFGASESFKLPKRATAYSAGYDIYTPFTFTLMPNEEITIPTGLHVYMNPGEVLVIAPRSGLGFKYYSRLANTIGIIDSDYINSENEGHIKVKLRNESDKNMTIKVGEAMCQALFLPFLITDDDKLGVGEKRNGGFGSTTK